jgi:hypothetical protein
MFKNKRTLGCLVCLFVFLMFFGHGAITLQAADNIKYLKNNIHTQVHRVEEYRASYANWTDPGKNHIIIPVNTPVTIGNFRRGFTLITQDSRKTIYFEYDESRMGMNEDQYIGLITSSQPVKIDDLSEVDRKGIKDGKVYEGMTKDGVRIALGYPAAHQTPSLNENTWVYWTNRFKSFKIEFNSTGKVTKVQ